MPRRLVLATVLIAALLAPAAAQAAPSTLVINEFDSDQPGTDASEFVELRNGGAEAVDLTGYRLRFVNGANNAQYQNFELTGSLGAGEYYVLCANTATVANCDQDVAPDTNLIQNGEPDGLALLDAGGAVVDSVSYGGTMPDITEGSSGAPDDTDAEGSSVGRVPDGCDTDENGTDFSRTSATPGASNGGEACSDPGGDAAPAVASSDPEDGDTGVDPDANLTVTFTEPVNDDSGAWAIFCSDGDPVGYTVTSSDQTTFTIDPDRPLPRGGSCTLEIDGDAIRDADSDDPPDNAADRTIAFSIAGLEGLRIHDIQGAAHISPYADRTVDAVPGVITARRGNGFYMQDPSPDADDRTSEGILVFTGGAPAAGLAVGDAVTVSGEVTEFRPGGTGGFANLTTTEITDPVVAETGAGAIAPTVVGQAGRRPPTSIIDNDTPDPEADDPPLVTGDVEAGSTFDPAQDGIDFYESLEGMLTEVRQAQAVQATSSFGEIPVVADRGVGVTNRNARFSLAARATDLTLPEEYRLGDFNPERIFLDDELTRPAPVLDTGDTLVAPVRAVVDYSFGNFKFQVLEWPAGVDGGLRPETTAPPSGTQLTVATYNVENLDPGDGERFGDIARQITGNLRSPDVVTIIEAQDNNGEAAGGTAADETFETLIEAIDAVGPTYDYRQIDPENNQDGGAPNGNIRVGFIFRPDRVSFVDRPGGTATNATEDDPSRPGAQLTYSPGRIDPTNPVWAASRKPLAGEFRFRGRTVFIVGNHFNSKGGDEPLFGRFQEPRRPSEVQRRGGTLPDRADRGQAGVVNAWVERLLRADPGANVIALGDFNDFDFSETLRVLQRGRENSTAYELFNLWGLIPERDRFSYIFEGNAQTLDHILISAGLADGSPALDAVHINTEFADQVSDHDPLLARVRP